MDKKKEKPIKEEIVIFLLFLIISISIFNMKTTHIQGIIIRNIKIKERNPFKMRRS
jgi:hypothetical protein